MIANNQVANLVDGSIGRFEIEHVIGHGGMGSVYLANDTMAGRQVAIKIPRYRSRPKRQGSNDPLEDSLREAKIASQLHHPHVVDLYEVGTWNDSCFFVSRFADAGDLATWLGDHPGPYPVAQVMPLLQTLADTIAYCHRSGICHLDLKPANVLFTSDADSKDQWKGFPGKPLITDFGIARMMGLDEVTDHSSVMMGTPMYLSPEQSSCRIEDLTPAADVFSFGVMAYELLTGQLPFAAETPIAYVDRIRDGQPDPFADDLNIPVGLQRVCMKCLATCPEDRYPNGAELVEDLLRVQSGQPVLDWKPTRMTCGKRWLSRPSRIQQAALVVFISNIAILGGFVAMIGVKAVSPESIPGTLEMLAVDVLKLVVVSPRFTVFGQLDGSSRPLLLAVDESRVVDPLGLSAGSFLDPRGKPDSVLQRQSAGVSDRPPRSRDDRRNSSVDADRCDSRDGPLETRKSVRPKGTGEGNDDLVN